MRTYLLIMGCTQTSERVIPPNHIPIERIYDNGDYRIAQPLPAVNIIALPTPPYVKSALKKTYPDMRGRADTFPFAQSKISPFNKGVNFDEQVLVKARTPTPTKVWYEKASSTMPMRRHGRNDDDDYDYDNEEPQSNSSDEEQGDQEQNDTESQLTARRPPTPLRHPNQVNPIGYQTDNLGFIPATNTMLENKSFPSTTQPYLNMPTYAAESQSTLPINRIKVRRTLANLGPPQILPASPYQPPVQYSTIPLYQSSTQPSIVPTYQIPAQTSIISPYQTPIQQTLPNTNAIHVEQRRLRTSSESLPQTAYYPYTRPPLSNIT